MSTTERVFIDGGLKFQPSVLSERELQLVAEHLGDSPAKVLGDPSTDLAGANPAVVREVLQQIRDDLENPYSGVVSEEDIKAGIDRYLKVLEAKKASRRLNKGATFHPEMHMRVSQDFYHGGRGSDFHVVTRYAFPYRATTDADRVAVADMIAEATGSPSSGSPAGPRVEADISSGYVDCPIDGCGYRAEFEPGDEADYLKGLDKLARHAQAKARTRTETADEHDLLHKELKG